MISSPCKNCNRKDLPKDDCLKDCQVLKTIQDIQISSGARCASIGIDCAEDTRYTVPLELMSLCE